MRNEQLLHIDERQDVDIDERQDVDGRRRWFAI